MAAPAWMVLTAPGPKEQAGDLSRYYGKTLEDGSDWPGADSPSSSQSLRPAGLRALIGQV